MGQAGIFDDIFDDIIREQEEQAEERDKCPFPSYINGLLDMLQGDNGIVKDSVKKPVPRPDGKYYCLKEPESFVKCFDSISSSQKKCQEFFQKLVNDNDSRVIEQVISEESKNSRMWFNSSASGLNLRPGLQNNERTKPTVVTFGKPQDSVHALIVGATGSGKSVFLHNLLFSMMAEYAPWELNIFLIDFKKVSFSKYLSECSTPHIKAVAATSEVRYVVSLLKYISQCMKARQTFFSYLGLEKLEDLRNKYKIILPRIVLLVDEFQQMFTGATARETEQIQGILTQITKLGRATGYHLIFASQEMSKTLGADAFANFKVRFALRCNADVSTDFLGNNAASKIGSREKGYVIENSVDGKEENNRTYKVPFIEEDGGYFYSFLREQTEMALRVGFRTVHKYYQEDFVEPFENLISLLKDDRVLLRKKEILSERSYLFDILTLGNAVTFNYKKNDSETVFLECGANKNIGLFCPTVADFTYLTHLLVTNFKMSSKADLYNHIVFVRNDYIERVYDIANDLSLTSDDIHRTDSDFDEYILDLIRMRKDQRALLQKYNQDYDLKIFSREAICVQAKYLFPKGECISDDALDYYSSFFENASVADIPLVISAILEMYNDIDEDFFTILKMLYQIECEGYSYTEVFEPCICWILGTEMIDYRPKDAERLLSDAAGLQILVVLAGSSERNIELYNSCDYLFIAGNQNKIYVKWDIPYTQKEDDSIVIDFKIRSAGTQRSFKKYKMNQKEDSVPQLDFDEILI